MDILSPKTLRKSLADDGKLHVSIFMPAHTIRDLDQDPVRLRGLLDQSETRLIESGLGYGEASELLLPARALLRDGALWQYRSEGLALFISPGFFHHYHVALPLEELVVVGNSFCIEPLLPLLAEAEHSKFYVLALGLKHIRLLKATRRTVREVALPEGVPAGIEEALRYDDFEMEHQLYSGTPGWGGGVPGAGGQAGRAGAVFYGQQVGSDLKKDNVLRYFQQINHGLHELLAREKAPLVLAGIDYLLPIYREASSYSHIVERGIESNNNGKTDEQLRDEAWQIVEPLLDKAHDQAIERYLQRSGTGRTSANIEEIVPAAYYGQVDTLLVAAKYHRWGTFKPYDRMEQAGTAAMPVSLHDTEEPGDEELVNAAAVHTLLNHGMVYVFDEDKLPEGVEIAALLRY